MTDIMHEMISEEVKASRTDAFLPITLQIAATALEAKSLSIPVNRSCNDESSRKEKRNQMAECEAGRIESAEIDSKAESKHLASDTSKSGSDVIPI